MSVLLHLSMGQFSKKTFVQGDRCPRDVATHLSKGQLSKKTFVQGDTCQRDTCPKETLVQGDFCPRKLLPVKSLLKLFIFYCLLNITMQIDYIMGKNNMNSHCVSNLHLGQKSSGTNVP